MSVISRNGAFQPQKLILLKLISAVGLAGYITLHINAVSGSFSKEISDYDLERIQGSSTKKNTTIRTRRDALRTFTPVIPNHDHTTDMDVIVYLAQFGHHSSYGQQTDGVNEITGTSKLNHSLTTLYENYVNIFPCDVIVFYSEGDNPDSDFLQELKKGRPRLKFMQLNDQWWSLPPGLSMSTRRSWKLLGFSVGYRHMIRWYSKLIWSYLHGLGYTHVMRIDDDSYIYSTIKYNLFEYMRDHNKRYAFRQPCTDMIGLKPLNALMDEFLKDNPNATTPELLKYYRRDRQLGFYNNWFMADISFFLSPPASTFLDIVDRSHIMYTHRTGDLSIQSAVVRLFLQPKEIQWFQDFTYQHVTISRRNIESGCPSVGALTRGEGTDLLQWRMISERFNSSFDPACDVRITARKNACTILHPSGEMPRLVCPPNSTYDCVGAEMCAMESLGLKEGHYLNEIVQCSKTW